MAGAILYLANNALLKPLGLPGPAGALVRGHLDDVLAGLAFSAYTNLLFDLVRPGRRLRSAWVVTGYMLCCGLFWEVVAPALLKPSVSDPWDVASYVVGGLGYWALDRARARHAAARNR